MRHIILCISIICIAYHLPYMISCVPELAYALFILFSCIAPFVALYFIYEAIFGKIDWLKYFTPPKRVGSDLDNFMWDYSPVYLFIFLAAPKAGLLVFLFMLLGVEFIKTSHGLHKKTVADSDTSAT